ncbi:MAG: hypothetical protein CM1200mP39_29630 [Dehalococcoidia bacterium]|nr:MAG: hypothetical protein CM1200mP39_29630 [Dehalococcoidia bacterium]
MLIVGAGVNGIVRGAQARPTWYSLHHRREKQKCRWHLAGEFISRLWRGHSQSCYSLSFGRRYRWSRYFSLRDEIQDYLERCTHEFGVQSHIPNFKQLLLVLAGLN